MRIAITAPSGNIGSRLCDQLIETDHKLILLARTPAKVQRLVEKGAEVLPGKLTDLNYVVESTMGVDALFWLTPADPASSDLRAEQGELGRVAAQAITENKIRRVVNVSSVGAHLGSGTGPVNGLCDVEKAINEAAENVVHLRPASFYENYFASLESIKTQGHIYLPVSPDTTCPMIATRDISAVAAEQLLDADLTGRNILELEGPTRMSFADAARQIGEGIGREVQHIQVPPDAVREALEGMGVGASFIDNLLELYESIESGHIGFEGGDAVHMDTPTSMTQFAGDTLKPMLGG